MSKFSSNQIENRFEVRQIQANRFQSMRKDEQPSVLQLGAKETKSEALCAALIVGEKSGECEPLDFDSFIAEKRQKHHQHP